MSMDRVRNMFRGSEQQPPAPLVSAEVPQDGMEHFAGVRKILETVMKDDPRIAGFTLFGAIAQQKVNESAGVDVHVFVNVADAESPIGYEMRHEEIEDRVREEPFFFLNDVTKKEISDMIKQKVTESGVSPEQAALLHLYVLPISEDIVRDAITRRIPATRFLSTLFHPQEGAGLTEYREQVLAQLRDNGEKGRTTWQTIATSLRKWKGKTSTPPRVQYPGTLDEAIALYAPSLNEASDS